MLGKEVTNLIGIESRLANQINMANLIYHGHLVWSI
jgi:hypothetical protein